jgi:hypothetical protein
MERKTLMPEKSWLNEQLDELVRETEAVESRRTPPTLQRLNDARSVTTRLYGAGSQASNRTRGY